MTKPGWCFVNGIIALKKQNADREKEKALPLDKKETEYGMPKQEYKREPYVGILNNTPFDHRVKNIV